MPTKGKLPNVLEMEDWVLVALQELGGMAHFTRIDAKVKELLVAAGVSKKALDNTIIHIRETSVNLKTSRCRTTLKKSGLLERAPGKGRWRLTASGETRANFRRTELGLGAPKAPVVNKLATDAGIKTDALAVLRDNNVPEEVLEKFLKQLISAESGGAEPDASPHQDNLAVERAAIQFIQSIEEGWHTTPPNNEGFDLYQTRSGRKNGKITVWCEVKSLSGQFSGVSLTRSEFEKAQECGEAYWLYIVENVGGDREEKGIETGRDKPKPQLLKIQNPAGKVKRFTYGHRWRSVAEKVTRAPHQEKPLL